MWRLLPERRNQHGRDLDRGKTLRTGTEAHACQSNGWYCRKTGLGGDGEPEAFSGLDSSHTRRIPRNQNGDEVAQVGSA